jgi:hypothetical protein
VSPEQIVAAILAPGVLGIIMFPYLQMARGKLVPQSFLEAERVDTEHWRKSSTDKDRVIAEQSAQLGEYMETTRLARNTWTALEQRAAP